VRDRLVLHEGILHSDTRIIFNGVDLQKFLPRAPLPDRPQRALAISNWLEPAQCEVLRAGCRSQGIELDAVGAHLGGSCEKPEQLLPQYDLVFAKGRCAWEALAVGAAVIICDYIGVGPLVTSEEMAQLRRANFGRRLMIRPLRPETIAEQIRRYNADDAALVSQNIRATAGIQAMVEQLLAVYHEAIAAHHAAPPDPADDMRAAARFLETWPGFKTGEPPPANAEAVAFWRQILREELQQTLRPTGLRKLTRSIRKRLKSFALRRGAA
jgi:hypothetical protein